jgi:hypothetical protein
MLPSTIEKSLLLWVQTVTTLAMDREERVLDVCPENGHFSFSIVYSSSGYQIRLHEWKSCQLVLGLAGAHHCGVRLLLSIASHCGAPTIGRLLASQVSLCLLISGLSVSSPEHISPTSITLFDRPGYTFDLPMALILGPNFQSSKGIGIPTTANRSAKRL